VIGAEVIGMQGRGQKRIGAVSGWL